ncbi:MAG: hypothetical protein R6W90_09675 [Ignavibacteriaceae bacterium]
MRGSRLKKNLRKIKKYTGMISTAATVGIILTTVIMKMRSK